LLLSIVTEAFCHPLFGPEMYFRMFCAQVAFCMQMWHEEISVLFAVVREMESICVHTASARFLT